MVGGGEPGAEGPAAAAEPIADAGLRGREPGRVLPHGGVAGRGGQRREVVAEAGPVAAISGDRPKRPAGAVAAAEDCGEGGAVVGPYRVMALGAGAMVGPPDGCCQAPDREFLAGNSSRRRRDAVGRRADAERGDGRAAAVDASAGQIHARLQREGAAQREGGEGDRTGRRESEPAPLRGPVGLLSRKPRARDCGGTAAMAWPEWLSEGR